MFGIGTTELVIIGIIMVLLFGSRLPKLMFSLGNSITQFKRGVQAVEDEVEETAHVANKATREAKESAKV